MSNKGSELAIATKTYTVRVPIGTPNITTDVVARLLEQYLNSRHELAADPGAGERSLRLSLEKQKVEEGARLAGEAEATFLRRLIASSTPMPPAEGQPVPPKDDPRPKPPMLKGPFKVGPKEVRAFVELYEAGQSSVIRRAFRAPNAVKAAAFTEQEREELSAVASEVVIRRAPRVLVENADLFALGAKLMAIESHVIARVRKEKEAQRVNSQGQAVSEPAQPRQAQPIVKASTQPASPAAKARLPEMIPFEPGKPEAEEGPSLESLPDSPEYHGSIDGGTGAYGTEAQS